jgi:hypothetical protein
MVVEAGNSESEACHVIRPLLVLVDYCACLNERAGPKFHVFKENQTVKRKRGLPKQTSWHGLPQHQTLKSYATSCLPGLLTSNLLSI